MWWESQNVGTADALTKTVSHFLQMEKEPEVKARVPIIFKNNCQILDEGCMHFNSRMTQKPLYCVQIITDGIDSSQLTIWVRSINAENEQ